jgi:hypothetical protein
MYLSKDLHQVEFGPRMGAFVHTHLIRLGQISQHPLELCQKSGFVTEIITPAHVASGPPKPGLLLL